MKINISKVINFWLLILVLCTTYCTRLGRENKFQLKITQTNYVEILLNIYPNTDILSLKIPHARTCTYTYTQTHEEHQNLSHCINLPEW